MPSGVSPKTIVAESSPPGRGGVSLIRASGPRSLFCLSKITKKNQKNYQPRVVYHRRLWDKNGDLIDRALVTYFSKPNSYTGENTVEVSCHGSPLVVAKVLSVFVSFGAVLAEPGEFTKRAFLNGKLNMLQAEAVGEIISAKTERSLQLNQKILNENDAGGLKKIKSDIVLAASNIEHALDISDEDLGGKFFINTIKSITSVVKKLEKYIKNYRENINHLRPPTVVFYGKPNAGKSTLFNALLNQERAITSATPGTTRDTIEQETQIGGLCVRLVDTAGTRETRNEVEAEGLRRTKKSISESDLVLHVVEGVDNIEDTENKIVVYNKNDLIKYSKQKTPKHRAVYTSAKKRAGLNSLKEEIKKHLLAKEAKTNGSIITTTRQLQAINESVVSLKKALHILKETNPEIELVAFELVESTRSLSALLGTTSAEDIMENVFENFCVGK